MVLTAGEVSCMAEETFLYKMRFLFVGLLVVASLFVLSLALPAFLKQGVQAKSIDTAPEFATISDEPNIITGGMFVAADELGKAVASAGYTVNDSARAVASAAAQSSKTIAHGTKVGVTAAARAVGTGAGYVGRAVGNGVGFVASIPGNVVDLVTNAPPVRAIIRPSDTVEVPIIDPNSPELQAALAALPPAPHTPSPPQATGNPAWPIRGGITTHFGVPHWPYQRTHSGLDISDGKPAGTTPIRPFRPGRVIETTYSRYGLGNRVVLDHGNGVTSVYAHLASISVQVGQEVGMDAILGYEGSTGASTGTHLHFEIRVHGQATDPRQFISGHPSG